MKEIKKISFFLMLLSCMLSCTKDIAPDADEAIDKVNTQSNSSAINPNLAQLNTVTGYWKVSNTLVSTLDATPGYTKVVVYSIGPISVKKDDVVSVHFQRQVSYSGADNVMIAGGVVIGANANVKDQLSSGFIGFASNHSGTNLTIEERGTEVISRTGSYKFAADNNNVFINAVMYAANLSGNPPGAVDPTLPAGYGDLVAVLESGVLRYETHTQAFTSMAVSGITFRNKTLGPYTILQNTMVDVRYELEATTAVPMPGGNNSQRLGRWVSQGSSANDQGGARLIRAMQLGATHGEHHMTVSHAGGRYYSSGTSGIYFNTTLYGNGWGAATNPPYPLKIEQSSANNYGHFVVEMRNASEPINQDSIPGYGSTALTTLTSTPQVLYSVGPIDIDENQVVEVRYQAGFAPTAGQGSVTVVSKIIRATSASATTGIEVQRPLAHVFHPYYTFNNLVQSTAERPDADQNGQYYNVIAWRTSGAASCPVLDWGELEAVKR